MNNIKHFIYKLCLSRLLFSILFSIALFLMSKIVFSGYVYNDNYIKDIFLYEYFILLFLIPIIYGILYLIEKYYIKITKIIITEKDFDKNQIFCIISFFYLFIIYFSYFLTFFPGGVYSDTWFSLKMLFGITQISNLQPVLYTLSLSLVKLFYPNFYIGFGLFSIIQILFMISIFLYFINWLLNKKINPIIVSFITIFLGLFKLFPLYSISIWKDTPFSLTLFLYILTLIDLIVDFKNRNIKISNILKISICTFLCILLRTNGFLMFIPILLLILTFIKPILENKEIINLRKFYFSILFVFILSQIISSLYPLLGITGSSTIQKSISIPVQQVARIIALDGNVTTEQKEMIDQIMPLEEIKQKYKSMIADPVRLDKNFNEEYLNQSLNKYFKLWLELLIQNPIEYINSFLLQTSGFWSFNVRGSEAYESSRIWQTYSEAVENIDIIAKISNNNISLKDTLSVKFYYSGGFFFWITLLSMFITFRTCEKKYLLAYLPGLLIWGTVMIATPMAQSLRYVYILVLMLPLNFVYPAIFKNKSTIILLNEKNPSS